MSINYNEFMDKEDQGANEAYPEGGVFVPGVYDSENLSDGIYIPFMGGHFITETSQVIASDLVTGKRYNAVRKDKLPLCQKCSKEITPLINEPELLEEPEQEGVIPVEDTVSEEILNIEQLMATLAMMCNTLRNKYEVGVIKKIADNVLSTDRYMLVLNFQKNEVAILLKSEGLDPILSSELSVLVTEVSLNFGWTVRIHGTYEVN
jgi:hypothetical protein